MGPVSRPKGTQDFLPPESEIKTRVESTFRDLAGRYGFREVDVPTFEHTEVFVKTAGETSDVVAKEMYSFRDRGDRDVTLRPEGTPGVVRAVLEAGLRLPARLFYTGSFFRYSRPQKGRYREFHQLGVEALGESCPLVDAEVIFLGHEFFRALGIADCTTQVNSIGCRACRPPYRQELVAWLTGHAAGLCEDCRVRTGRNPLRVFDCKNDACRAALGAAPRPRQHLCPDCQDRFRAVLADLERRGLPFTVNETLVRGLDYYSRTTFEYVSASLGAQDSLGGGGRYDYLLEEMGGPDAPAVGFALGLERTMLAMPRPAPARRPLVFVVWFSLDELPAAQRLVDELRAAGLAARLDCEATAVEKKLKHQLRAADAAAASHCLIVGPDELARGVYSLKDLATAGQSEIPAAEVTARLRALFA
ncbi:histidine--tRNA ligase [candidate division WOR-3 bacterium]|nr:histidine--tRNA ligase [candidate division WOR-3 bacterium]